MRHLWAGMALLAAGLATAACSYNPPRPAFSPALGNCDSAGATIAFDFAGAPPLACSVTGEREFTLLLGPEHAPPINPSPWYAFRYYAQGEAPVRVKLQYLEGEHRYTPKLSLDDVWSDQPMAWRDIPAKVAPDGRSAQIDLPPGAGVIAAQELMMPFQSRQALARWALASGSQTFAIGSSHDGAPIMAVRLGREDAPQLVVLLGRQHPPEVTGAIAMEAFVDALAERAGGLGDVQVLVVPMMNPDGVMRGHWRANRGATDLNRDWGPFTQPETRAVKAWLNALPQGVRPVLMVDFHSTRSNLFYVQGDDEMDARQRRFLAAWLGGQEAALAGYPFTIEQRNANPGSGTAKNWFHAAYAIPAYTYEVADTADRAAIRTAARALAGRLFDALAAAQGTAD